ncbi:MAG TPA: universal stress protein [Nitrososphaera sp.]
MAYSKILVPYDIANPGDNALEHAVKLAKVNPDTEIILLHVITEIPIYPVMEHAIKSRKNPRFTAVEEHAQYVYSAMKDQAIKILDEKKHEYELREGLKKIRTDVVLGRPTDKILEYAESKGVELIIIGSAKYGSIAKKLKILGSVSKGVLERAKCSVMVVR